MFKYLSMLILSVSLVAFSFGRNSSTMARIKVRIKHGSNVDSIIIGIWQQNVNQPYSASDLQIGKDFQVRSMVAYKNSQGCFEFLVDSVLQPNYVTLAVGFTHTGKLRPFMEGYILEAGNDVMIDVDSIIFPKKYNSAMKADETDVMVTSLSFSGKGSAIFACRKKIEESTLKLANKVPFNPDFYYPRNTSGEHDTTFWYGLAIKYMNAIDYLGIYQDSILQLYRDSVSRMSYFLLKADIQCKNGDRLTNMIKWLPSDMKFRTDSLSARIIVKKVNSDYLRRMPDYKKGIPTEVLQYSYWFPFVEVSRLSMLGNSSYVLSVINGQYSGIIRDKLLVVMVNKMSLNGSNLSNQEMDTLRSLVKSPVYVDYVNKILGNYTVGKLMQNFTLPDNSGLKRSLREFIGKTLVVDFWFTGCAPCQLFYQDVLSKTEQRYRQDTSVMFVSISIDLKTDTWKKSLVGGTYSSISASNVVNLYTEGQGYSHPIIKAYNISAFPTILIVDSKGRLSNFNGRSLSNTVGLWNAIDKARSNL